MEPVLRPFLLFQRIRSFISAVAKGVGATARTAGGEVVVAPFNPLLPAEVLAVPDWLGARHQAGETPRADEGSALRAAVEMWLPQCSLRALRASLRKQRGKYVLQARGKDIQARRNAVRIPAVCNMKSSGRAHVKKEEVPKLRGLGGQRIA